MPEERTERTSMRFVWKSILISAVVAAATFTAAQAQWSIGAPGKREAPAGKHRYIYLVFANPIPGLEAEFNDWYSRVHPGDLVQLPGWIGAQRFRIVTTVQPPPSTAGYRHGYLMIWDLEASDAGTPLVLSTAAIAGGKSRKGAGFNYNPGAGSGGTYEAMGPRITRPDGKGPTLTDPSDNKTPRPNRYMLMEFSNVLPGKDAEFDKFANQRIPGVLALPGWLAAQRFRMAETTGRPPGDKPKYLTVWEAEGISAQAINVTLNHAVESGAVKKNGAADENTAEIVYWEPISPHIGKDDFER
jgi:hypothetical protein